MLTASSRQIPPAVGAQKYCETQSLLELQIFKQAFREQVKPPGHCVAGETRKLQLLASLPQVATVEVLAQTGPVVPTQTGSGLHVQLAAPDGPVQLWFVGHALGGPYEKQPLVPSVHVARPPLMHDF